jgi:hypothetical protein
MLALKVRRLACIRNLDISNCCPRGKGRPREGWQEYEEGLARKRGRKLPEVRRLAQDRNEYRKWLLKPVA